MRSAHGLLEIDLSWCLITIGGRSVVRRYERVRASRNVRGPSVSKENEGIMGRYSTMSCPNMYNNGNLGEVTKEGVKRSQGAVSRYQKVSL